MQVGEAEVAKSLGVRVGTSSPDTLQSETEFPFPVQGNQLFTCLLQALDRMFLVEIGPFIKLFNKHLLYLAGANCGGREVNK